MTNIIEAFSKEMHSRSASDQTDNHANIRNLAQQLKYINANGLDVPTERNLADNASQEDECYPTPFRRFSLKELAELPPKQWLIDQIIGPGDLGMIFGPPGSGKTFTAIDMALAGSLGREFAGWCLVEKPLNVVYIAGEGYTGIPQRFMTAAERQGVNLDALTNLEVIMDMPQLYDRSDQLNVARFVEQQAAQIATGKVTRPDLLFIDTLHSATNGADENSSQHMGEVIHQLKDIARKLKCAIFLVHHSNKGGDDYRGSTSLRGAMDIMIRVTGDDNPRTMSCYKLKDGEQWKPRAFNLKKLGTSQYVEWGATIENSAGDSKAKTDGRKSDTGRRTLEILYLADIESEQDDNPKENAGWLLSFEITDKLGLKNPPKEVLGRLEKGGYIICADRPSKGGKPRHWSIAPAGKKLWEAIKDNESIPI